MKKKPNLRISMAICLLMFAISCSLFNKDDVKPENKLTTSIEIGQTNEVASSTINSSGGSIKISNPATPVDGLEITIPANSFSSAQTVKVAYAEIKSHQFGQYFNPISPMITITCDGGYSSEIMSVTIPVKVPEGNIPLGFFLDETTGKLEGIPIENYTANSITLLTRHFLPGSKLHTNGLSLKSASATTANGANIIISSISESLLNSQPIIASGFKPGIDDWEFVNYGSYIATGGHCAGQNMTAMWYYFEKKPTDGNLFNKFSDNANLWQDDAKGYRFCSVIHNDLDWDGTVATLFDKYIDKNQEMDKLKLYTIAGAMLVTGEPQGIGIYRQTGTKADGTPKYGGHDLICYQVSTSGGKLYISDPNTPGTGQSIDFTNTKFQPYLAKLNGNDASHPYPFVTYYAKTAYIEWNKIGQRYGELVSNTIGTVAPNTFPAYTIWQKGKVDSELKDGLVTNSDTLRCTVECPTTERGFHVNNKWLIWFNLYDEKGNEIDKWEGSGKGYVILNPGLNKIGFYIYSQKNGAVDSNGNYNDLFIDFKWITVNYSTLSIDPNPLQGEPEKEYKLTAQSKGSAPKSAKYVWDFGDGSSQATIQNDSTVTHTFAKEGTFNVKVELYDNSNNKKVAEATSLGQISSTGGSGTFEYYGKTYAYKTIGTQTWMVENLAYLPTVSYDTEGSKTSPYYYVYGYNGTNVDVAKTKANYTTYGVLYNGPAALKSCPPGWHLPSEKEWRTLENYLGTSAGGKMKETGTIHWSSPNTGATNASGFKATGGGLREGSGGGTEQLGLTAVFWSSSEDGSTNTLGFVLDNFSGNTSRWSVFNPSEGFSIRCVKN
ncbi:MAG TPA: FISUMP domain-containing protein [Prolixibacteraceae bacterium]